MHCHHNPGATDGNLGAHIETLAKAGYVSVDKAFVGKKPQTTVTAPPPAAAPSHGMWRRCRRSLRGGRCSSAARPVRLGGNRLKSA